MSLAILLSSIAQCVIAILLIVVLWYLIGIVRNIREISDRARRGSEIVSNDLFEIRRKVQSESMELWTGLTSFIQHLPQAVGLGKKKKRVPKEIPEEPDLS